MKRGIQFGIILFCAFLILPLSIAGTINTDGSQESTDSLCSAASNPANPESVSTNTFRNYANLTGHGWRVREVAFSPVEPILASGSSDGSIRLWNLTNGKVLHVLMRHHYGVIALDFSPSGKLLASGGIDNKINLWNVSSGEHLQTWSMYPHGVIDLKWSPDGKTLAVGGGEWMVDTKLGNQPDKLLRILNGTTGKVLRSFIGHTDAVMSIAFSKDGSKLISGSWDKSIRLWNVSSGLELSIFANHTHKVTSAVFSRDESMIISGSLDETVKLWNVGTGEIVRELLTNHSIWSIAHSPVDHILAVAVDPSITWPNRYWLTFGELHDCFIQLWDINNGEIIDILRGHRNAIESVKFSTDGAILASASWDWQVKLWGDHSSLSPEGANDQWSTSTLEKQGIDPDTFFQQVSYLDDANLHNLHSLLVIRFGKLAYERYFEDEASQVYTPEMKHTLFSATKSFTAALIGIAIDKGYIESTEQPILDFFPNKTFANVDSRKKAMTLHHLLTMTAGLEWSDGGPDFWEMAIAEDSVAYILSKPMVAEPGSVYTYSSGASQILSAIIQETTGYSTFDFAMKYLFEPLGITELDIAWVAGSDGINHGGVGLFITPRNMAKFGQLFLDEGVWEGNRVISSSWIKECSQDHIEGISRSGMPQPAGYGYQFWLNDYPTAEGQYYYALGFGGQTIQIFPKYDLVIVTTARYDEPNALFISDAIISSLIPGFTPESSNSKGASWAAFPWLVFPWLISFAIVRRKKKQRMMN
ncbi:MAG: serine hydrolase [Candidatus Thorarchaeota archaeon]